MNEIFRPYLRRFILIFFYDILVYSRTIKDHLQYLKVTLGILRQHHLVAKASKCKFACAEVTYLSHLILA